GRKMKKKPIITSKEAVNLINDGDSVAVEGSGGGLVEPDALLKSLKDRYKETLTPKNLTLVHCTGIGDREGGGIGHLAQENLIKRVIAGNWAMAPKMGEMALDNKIEAYNFPQGVMAKMFREIAAGNPGLLSRVGKETF